MDARPWGNDRAQVQEQYATVDRLRTRASFWAPSPEGESPQDHAIEALRAAGAHRVLEIGCGQGAFAERTQRELGADVLATDASPAMVSATRRRGLTAMVVDATDLPFGDAELDAVVAMWMLYHVPDLDRTLAEIRRVVRPGGVLVAVTNGRRHLADLFAAAGLPPLETAFMTEDAEAALRRHFGTVSVTTTRGRAVADHDTARAYLSTLSPEAAARLPVYDGTRTYRGSSAVLVAR